MLLEVLSSPGDLAEQTDSAAQLAAMLDQATKTATEIKTLSDALEARFPPARVKLNDINGVIDRQLHLPDPVAALADRGGTFLYFIPRMLRLLRTADSPGARADMRQWARLNYLRIWLMLVAWLTALQALSLLKGQPG